MILGRYEIETYFVVLNDQTTTRERIIYTGINEVDIFIERYYGTIRAGYRGANTIFRNLSYDSLRTHIAGESIVLNDSSSPPQPQIYFTIASIESIQRDGALKLVIIDTQIDPITLEFLTPFDCNQAYSVLNYLLQNIDIDINELEEDSQAPIIFFNELFFGHLIKLDIPANPELSGPFSSEDGTQFRIDFQWDSFGGDKPLTKGAILEGLIYDITDDRDGSLATSDGDILVYKDTISPASEVNSIGGPGTYILKFQLSDFVKNQNSTTVIFSIT